MITNFKIFESKISSSELKEYAQYLMNIMIKLGLDQGRKFLNLRQFYEEDKIKDIFSKNTSNEIKKEVLNDYAQGITTHFKANVWTFEEFQKYKELGINPETYDQTTKYNL